MNLDFKDVQQQITNHILTRIIPIWGIGLVGLFIAIIATPIVEKSRLITLMFSIVNVAVISTLLKKKRVKGAGSVFVILSLFTIFVGMYKNGGAYAVVFSGSSLLVIWAVIFFNFRNALVLLLALVTISFSIVQLQVNGMLPNVSGNNPINIWLAITIFTGLSFYSVYAAVNLLRIKYEETILLTEESKKSSAYISTVFNSLDDLLITVSVEGIIVDCNKAALKILGKNKDELIGTIFASTYHFYDDSGKNIEFSQETIRQTLLFLEIYGEELFFGCSKSPLVVDETVTGYVISAQNLTEERMLKEQLFQSQKMEAIGQLSSGVAHDFNNMLGGILGAANLLKTELQSDNSIELIELIEGAADQAASLTGKLLDYGRKGKLVSKSVDLHSVIKKSVDLLERTLDKSITIEVDCSANYSGLIGDATQLQNGIINMAINASHAMPNGGTLSFKTSNTYLTAEYCQFTSSNIVTGDYICLEVSDTGSGIPKNIIKQIFEPFFTTKKDGQGTGLGLAAVYGMVESHHGTVTVYSEENIGTSFNIYLPIKDVIAEHSNSSSEIPKGDGEKILIIDDEEIIRRTGTLLLESLNYCVETAVNGKEGVDKIKSGDFDLILLDMIMPVMNGREALKEIRTFSKDLPVILCSGFSKESDLSEITAHSNTYFIRKPYQTNFLAQTVSKAITLAVTNE